MKYQNVTIQQYTQISCQLLYKLNDLNLQIFVSFQLIGTP